MTPLAYWGVSPDKPGIAERRASVWASFRTLPAQDRWGAGSSAQPSRSSPSSPSLPAAAPRTSAHSGITFPAQSARPYSAKGKRRGDLAHSPALITVGDRDCCQPPVAWPVLLHLTPLRVPQRVGSPSVAPGGISTFLPRISCEETSSQPLSSPRT